MEPITVTHEIPYSDADIKAQLTEEGRVSIWFQYTEQSSIPGQQRHKFHCTPEEWDRLVAWVEWRRKRRKDVEWQRSVEQRAT